MNSIIITSMNLNFCNGFKDSRKRNINELVEEFIIQDSTFIAIQEFGTSSMTNDIDGILLIELLQQHGYELIDNEKKAKYPVNTCIFYKACRAEFLEKIDPLYQNLQNRQCAARFIVNNKKLSFYSIHLPLYSNNKDTKIEFWKKILDFAESNTDDVIFAGDFNENILTPNVTVLSENIYKLEDYFTNASSIEPTWKDRKLDYIFVSKNLTEKITSFETSFTKVSDHKKLSLTIQY